ncbi:hypothetical protein ACGTRS_03765 [Burkholderia semiarida]|uniref:Uncharacterized protein n=1 Tax=Burkholderia semiarida TaxID=2843303 RepID=A0ABW7L0I8_9BURK|nr:hypothetical protein [Burkholderia sp. AU39826]MCA7971144.1 hypothetical protein [Burkholderia sp. AU39826]
MTAKRQSIDFGVARRTNGKLRATTSWKARAKWKRLRSRYSTRVLAVIEHMLVEHLSIVMPSSLLGKALQYMSEQ